MVSEWRRSLGWRSRSERTKTEAPLLSLPLPDDQFERHVLDYLIYHVGKGRAQETVRWRKSPLSMFGRYLSRNGIRSVTEVSRKIAEEYLASLKSGAFSSRGKPISDGTYRDHLIALIADAREAEGRRPVRLPHALTAEEMMKIIQASSHTTALGLLDRAVLELLYSTGIRQRELVNLTLGDFRVESHELLIVNGKGGKDRVVPVGDWACYFTEAYVKNVRPGQARSLTEKALFVQHRNGRRLSPRAVGDIVERATHMLRNHADLRHIQAILGHTSLRSTQVYTHVNIEDLKEVMRRSHPHGRRTGSVKL